MKILLTGSAGYLGDVVAENCLARNAYLHGVDNMLFRNSYLRPGLTFYRADIRDDRFLKLLYDCEWDAVIHCAAIVGDAACSVNPSETHSVNEEAVKTLVKHTSKNTRLIFLSTCSVYGASDKLLTEESKPNPLSIYAETKLKAEEYVRKHPKHTIFRLGTVFGASTPFGRIRSDLVANILTFKACDGETLEVYGGHQWRPLVAAKDIGRIVADAAFKDFNGTFILGQANYRIIDVAKSVHSLVPGCPDIKTTDIKFEDMRNYKVDTTKAKNAGISYNYLLRDGIRELVTLYKYDERIKNVWLPEYNNGKYTREVLNASS